MEVGYNILTTYYYRPGEDPIPQRDPPDDDEKSYSGLLTEE